MKAMVDVYDRGRVPNLAELTELVGLSLFRDLTEYLCGVCGASQEFMYSRDKVLLGWNVRFFKAGRTLCRLYPREESFFALLVIGRREAARALALLPTLSREMRALWQNTREGMGQRWLLFNLKEQDAQYVDVCTFIRIRAESKERATLRRYAYVGSRMPGRAGISCVISTVQPSILCSNRSGNSERKGATSASSNDSAGV